MPRAMELVGREREHAALHDAIATAAGGDGVILLVAGEGGVGKTALVESALAQDGKLVLRGAADQRAVRPYAPIVAALRAYQRAVPDGLGSSGPLAEHLALILPELGAPAPDTDQATLFEAIGNLLEQIARRDPTVVFLDDLQWADDATAELLLHLDRMLKTAPMLLLGAYRSDEVSRGHPLRRVRSELRRRRRLQELMVEPLGPVETAQLAARVLGARPGSTLARTLYDRTQGVPFFIEELAVALATAGRLEKAEGTMDLGPEETLPLPDTIKETVLLRAERLSSTGRHTLEIAAAAGLGFDLELVAALGGADASTKRSSGDSWWRWANRARSDTPSSVRPSTTTRRGPGGAATTGGWRPSWSGAARPPRRSPSSGWPAASVTVPVRACWPRRSGSARCTPTTTPPAPSAVPSSCGRRAG